PKLSESVGAGADRPALARQGRFGRSGTGNLPRGASPLSSLSRPNSDRVRRVAAANPGGAPGQASAPLPGNQRAECPPGTRAGTGAGPVVECLRQSAGDGQLAQRACGPPRTCRAPGRSPRAAAQRLSRGLDSAASGRMCFRRSGPAHGPDGGQRQETLGPRPAALTRLVGGNGMNAIPAMPATQDYPPLDGPALEPDDPRVLAALEEYGAALEAGA